MVCSLVLRIPWGVRRMRPMMEGIDKGRCFRMRSLVSSGQVAKKPLSMAFQKWWFGRYCSSRFLMVLLSAAGGLFVGYFV